MQLTVIQRRAQRKTDWREPGPGSHELKTRTSIDRQKVCLRGIRRNDLFIWPMRHYADGIRYRMDALTRGMPFNYVSDELRKRVSGFNDIPVYLNQTQVPPWQEWDEIDEARKIFKFSSGFV